MYRYPFSYLRVFLISLIFPISAQAATYFNKTVKTVKVNNTGIYFSIEEGMLDPEGCGDSSNNFYHVDSNSPYEKELYSQLLTAKASGAKIRFGLSGCASGYPKVYRIDIL